MVAVPAKSMPSYAQADADCQATGYDLDVPLPSSPMADDSRADSADCLATGYAHDPDVPKVGWRPDQGDHISRAASAKAAAVVSAAAAHGAPGRHRLTRQRPRDLFRCLCLSSAVATATAPPVAV